MTSEEILKAESIIKEWFWQPDSWHRKSVVRYYESAPIQPDVLQLVIAYLKQEETSSLFILNKQIPLGETWKATDAWFQTSPSDKWAGTESTKVRIYQSFKPKADENDGPYTVENGCKYRVTHEFHWDVSEIPNLPASSSGIQYTLQGVTRDKDTGLYSCVVEKRETVQQDVDIYRSGGTVFESVQEEQHLGVKSNVPAGMSASAGNGIIVTRKVQKNPDCTSDILNTKTTENAVKNSTVVFEKTLRGTRKTTIDRNQVSPLKENGIVVGERRSSQMTDGGRYNNETTKTTPNPAGTISESCERTVFDHAHEKTTNQAKAPNDPEASSAGSGKTYVKTTRKTEEGTFDVTERTNTEQNVPSAVVVCRRTLRGVTQSVTDRNAALPLSSDGLSVGETRRSEKTPGGLYNNTSERTISTPAGTIAERCERTVFEHAHEKTTNQANEPSDPEASSAGSGKTYVKTTRKTEEGTFDVTEETKEEIPAQNTQIVLERMFHGTRRTVVHRNQPGTELATPGIGSSATAEKTPGNLVNIRRVEFTPQGFGIVGKTEAKNFFARVSKSTSNGSGPQETVVPQPEEGTTLSKEMHVFEDTTSDLTTQQTEFIERTWDLEPVETNFIYEATTCFRNAREATLNAIEERVTTQFDAKINGWINAGRIPSGHNILKDVTRNESGTYDGKITAKASWPETSAGKNGTDECLYFATTFSYYSFDPWGDRNIVFNHDGSTRWDGTWHGTKYDCIRAAGRGINVLKRLSGMSCALHAPQISYNNTTGDFELQIVTQISLMDRIMSWPFQRRQIESLINGIQTRRAP